MFSGLEHISSKFRQLRIDSKIDDVIGSNDNSDYKDSVDKMKNKVIIALKNPDFMKYYDFLCLSSIIITDFISMFDPEKISDLKDLVESIKGEQIILLKDFLDK